MVVDKIFIADTETLSFFIYFFLCVSVTQWLHSISTCMTPVTNSVPARLESLCLHLCESHTSR